MAGYLRRGVPYQTEVRVVRAAAISPDGQGTWARSSRSLKYRVRSVQVLLIQACPGSSDLTSHARIRLTLPSVPTFSARRQH